MYVLVYECWLGGWGQTQEDSGLDYEGLDRNEGRKKARLLRLGIQNENAVYLLITRNRLVCRFNYFQTRVKLHTYRKEPLGEEYLVITKFNLKLFKRLTFTVLPKGQKTKVQRSITKYSGSVPLSIEFSQFIFSSYSG